LVCKSYIFKVCQTQKSQEQNVLYAVKSQHALTINIVAINVSRSISIKYISTNGNLEKKVV